MSDLFPLVLDAPDADAINRQLFRFMSLAVSPYKQRRLDLCTKNWTRTVRVVGVAAKLFDRRGQWQRQTPSEQFEQLKT